ncbi:hypothetical protein [Granulicella mallensis]|nr:hypothetical protein [Granulicella mallensis]
MNHTRRNCTAAVLTKLNQLAPDHIVICAGGKVVEVTLPILIETLVSSGYLLGGAARLPSSFLGVGGRCWCRVPQKDGNRSEYISINPSNYRPGGAHNGKQRHPTHDHHRAWPTGRSDPH